MVNPHNRIFIEHAQGLFNPAILTKLREQFIAFEKNDALKANVSEREAAAIERGESSDRMRMQDCWYDVWRNPVSKEKLIEALDPFTWVMFPVQVRHVRTNAGHAVPWHQDAGYMKLHPAEKRHNKIVTCFVPIEAEPRNHTTIQFCTDNKDQPDIAFDHEAMAGFGAGLDGNGYKNVFHYDLNLGDALVFGDLALHRTFTPEGAQVQRRSLEFRLIDPADALPGKDYFDIKQQVFVQKDGSIRKVMYG